MHNVMKVLLGGAALVALVATAAVAAETQAPMGQGMPMGMHRDGGDRAGGHHRHGMMGMLAYFDADKDGTVTVEEALAHPDARFAELDANKDGFADKAELTAFYGTSRQAMADRQLARLDANADGKISKDEFEKPMRKHFALFDLNDDGKVTKAELELSMPMGGGWGGRHHGGMMGDRGGMMGGGRHGKHHWMRGGDAQGDATTAPAK